MMKTQQPIREDDEHRVLKFVPRSSAQPPHSSPGLMGQTKRATSPRGAEGLERYETPREEPDDFHHRMLANSAAFVLTVALIAIGIWLAVSISDLRKTQDCLLTGRRDCARIAVPHN
jgi:hypothetical protein